jgi:pyrimidine operon attenuation protein/uracil phosphoribosyltransferase
MSATDNIDELIAQMAADLRQRLAEAAGGKPPLIVGIHTGGVWVADRLHRALGLHEPMGALDISFYRDDFSRIGINPTVRPSELPISLDDRHVILVDDVLQTGRTVRAALDELFDFGRPARVWLAVLVDRGGRELPISADVIGCRLQSAPGENVKLIGPNDLRLVIQRAA